jgi:hypothetical protein
MWSYTLWYNAPYSRKRANAPACLGVLGLDYDAGGPLDAARDSQGSRGSLFHQRLAGILTNSGLISA